MTITPPTPSLPLLSAANQTTFIVQLTIPQFLISSPSVIMSSYPTTIPTPVSNNAGEIRKESAPLLGDTHSTTYEEVT